MLKYVCNGFIKNVYEIDQVYILQL